MNGLIAPINRAPMAKSDSITQTLKVDLAWRRQRVREFDRFTRSDRSRIFRLTRAEIDPGMQGRLEVGDRH